MIDEKPQFRCIFFGDPRSEMTFGHVLTFEIPSSLLVAAFPITAFVVIDTTRPAGTEHVAFEGSLHVTSDNFNDTLLDRDSQNYQEKKDKYEDMVS